MPERTFTDPEKQIVVRLTDDSLVYAPTGATGWQCRLEDIGWTSSSGDARGIQEVRLHAVDGRVAATIPQFDQIERFYLALLRDLAAHPFFDPVRDTMPSHYELMEKVLWLARQAQYADGPWEAIRMGKGAGAVASAAGLLLMPSQELHVERIPWPEVAGFCARETGGRFYRADSYVEVPLPDLHPAFTEACARHRRRLEAEGAEPPVYQVQGLSVTDPQVALCFSWELEAARDEQLLDADERIYACAAGPGRGSILLDDAAPAPVERPALMGAVNAVLAGGRPAEGPQIKTELFLTSRRLLEVDRDEATNSVVDSAQLGCEVMFRLRRAGDALFVGGLELRPESRSSLDVPGAFVAAYKRMLSESFDPFSPDVAEPPRVGRTAGGNTRARGGAAAS